jgi:hypothetical protein
MIAILQDGKELVNSKEAQEAVGKLKSVSVDHEISMYHSFDDLRYQILI